MKLLLAKLLLLSVPFIAYATVVIIIDPFNCFGVCRAIPEASKRKSSTNQYLWKVLEYRNSRQDKIILGDSRTDTISTETIKEVTGESYYNLAFSGASLPDIIDAFWLAAAHGKLSKVYIGLNFNLYNANFKKNDVKYVNRLLSNKLLYFIDVNVMSATRNLLSSMLGREAVATKKPVDPVEVWRYTIGPVTDRFYTKYSYPAEYRGALARIADYCQANGIALNFIILPTHVDLQRAVKHYRLEEQQKVFKEEVKTLARVYDFDFQNALTSDRNNFKDPYHLKSTQKIIDEVWGNGKKGYAVVSYPWAAVPLSATPHPAAGRR